MKIDTNEYEGHTAGPWEANLDDEGKRWIDAYDDEGDINLCRVTNGNKADAQLMADAPLLKEEVLRLLKQLDRYTQFVLWVESEYNEVFHEYEGKDEL